MTEEELREKLCEIIDEPGGGLASVTERKAARIMQLIKADRKAAVKRARSEAVAIVVGDITNGELDSIIERAEKVIKLIAPLRELRKMGRVRRKKMYTDFIEERDIEAQLQSHQPTNTKEKE